MFEWFSPFFLWIRGYRTLANFLIFNFLPILPTLLFLFYVIPVSGPTPSWQLDCTPAFKDPRFTSDVLAMACLNRIYSPLDANGSVIVGLNYIGRKRFAEDRRFYHSYLPNTVTALLLSLLPYLVSGIIFKLLSCVCLFESYQLECLRSPKLKKASIRYSSFVPVLTIFTDVLGFGLLLAHIQLMANYFLKVNYSSYLFGSTSLERLSFQGHCDFSQIYPQESYHISVLCSLRLNSFLRIYFLVFKAIHIGLLMAYVGLFLYRMATMCSSSLRKRLSKGSVAFSGFDKDLASSYGQWSVFRFIQRRLDSISKKNPNEKDEMIVNVLNLCNSVFGGPASPAYSPSAPPAYSPPAPPAYSPPASPAYSPPASPAYSPPAATASYAVLYTPVRYATAYIPSYVQATPASSSGYAAVPASSSYGSYASASEQKSSVVRSPVECAQPAKSCPVCDDMVNLELVNNICKLDLISTAYKLNQTSSSNKNKAVCGQMRPIENLTSARSQDEQSEYNYTIRESCECPQLRKLNTFNANAILLAPKRNVNGQTVQLDENTFVLDDTTNIRHELYTIARLCGKKDDLEDF